MHKPLVFIHIPKTAGTSIRSMMAVDLLQKGILSIPPYNYGNDFIEGSYKQIIGQPFLLGMRHLDNMNGGVRHDYSEIDFKWSVAHMTNKELWDYWVSDVKDKSQNRIIETHLNRCRLKNGEKKYDYTTSVISDLSTNEHYKDFNWMTILRNPVERVISEFYFMKILYKKNGYSGAGVKRFWGHMFTEDELINITLDDYINRDEVSNTQTKMLWGKGYLNKYEITTEDYKILLDTLSRLDFKIGIMERMNETIDMINDSFDFNISKSKQLHFKKNEYKSIVSDELKEKIKEKNKWDNLLYNKVKNNVL